MKIPAGYGEMGRIIVRICRSGYLVFDFQVLSGLLLIITSGINRVIEVLRPGF